MKILEELLDNYYITKKENYSKFYDIQDNLKDIQEFVREDLGYNLLKNNQVIKLTVTPANAKEYMGISSFTSKTDYILFTLFLMYLEDKPKGDEFILSNLTDYIKHTLITICPNTVIDFTKYENRKSLVRVLKFAASINLVILHDGSEENFSKDERAEVLYEATGISKYFMRNFSTDLSNISHFENIIYDEEQRLGFTEKDKQKHRVYRRLITEPVIYSFENEKDFEYIKSNRLAISKEISKHLDASLFVHKNMAYILLNTDASLKNVHPNIRTISDIVLLFANYLREKCLNDELNYNNSLDILDISRVIFEEYLLAFKKEFKKGFSLEFKEMNDTNFILEVINYMLDFKYIAIKDNIMVTLLPITFKLIGRYPSDFSLEDIDENTQIIEDKEVIVLDNKQDNDITNNNIQENTETNNVSPDNTNNISDEVVSLFDILD